MNLKYIVNRNSIRLFVDVLFGDDNNVCVFVKGFLELMEVDLVFILFFDGIENFYVLIKYSNFGKKYNVEFIMLSWNKVILFKFLLDLDLLLVVFEIVVNIFFLGLEIFKFMIISKGFLCDFILSIDL